MLQAHVLSPFMGGAVEAGCEMLIEASELSRDGLSLLIDSGGGSTRV